MANDTMYLIKNRSASICVYRIAEDHIRRVFQPGEVKKISAVELEKLTYQPGGLAILSNFLQIIDTDARAQIGLRTEPEYDMDRDDIIKMLKEGSMDQFLDCLDFAPPGVIDLIKQLSVSLPLTDYNKREALKNKIGFEVDKAIELDKLDKEQEPKEAPIRRTAVAQDTNKAAAPERRATIPQYNRVDKK